MRFKTFLLAIASLFFLTSANAFAQGSIEVGGYVGGQINGGLDLSTSLFHRFEVGNGLNYGATAGVLLGEHFGVEFQWNQNKADTRAQPNSGAPSIKLLTLNQNQYMGNFLLHATGREAKFRPYVLFGLGANHLDTDHPNVNSTTKFAYALGGGAKYYMGKHFGLRGQIRWAPTYITTTSDGYWCDPFWGGCWVTGNDHYLHSIDFSGGITLRF